MNHTLRLLAAALLLSLAACQHDTPPPAKPGKVAVNHKYQSSGK